MITLSHKTAVADILHAPLPRAKVLLVDDRHDKMLALASIFDGLGLELILAHSGSEALRLLLIHDVAVILLDVMMPVMDGFETAELIRNRKRSERTPIIFITAMDAADDHVSRGYSLGAVDYIFAPVNPEVLRAKVSVFIDLFLLRTEAERSSNHLRQQAEHKTHRLEARLDSLLDRLDVGVSRSSLSADLITANPAFLNIYGIAPTIDLRTLNMKQFYLRDGDRMTLLKHLNATGHVHEFHVEQRRSDGRIIWVSMSKVLVTDADGQVYIDGLVEDITLRKEAETALLNKSEELARSNAELEEFAYVASHDLQEPLRMVSSYSSLLEHCFPQCLTDKSQTYLAQITEGAHRMQELIRDILAFSKIGKVPTKTPVDCNDVLEKALYNLQGIIAASGAQISHDHLPTVIGEPILLGQVFQNLISNAVKFRHTERRPVVHIGAEVPRRLLQLLRYG
jgi:PAS domain S-box-containing protein